MKKELIKSEKIKLFICDFYVETLEEIYKYMFEVKYVKIE